MTILADEGVDREIVLRLRDDGHDVTYVAEMDPGISDEVVLARANAQGAILLTQDKDFGELVFRQRLSARGLYCSDSPALRPMQRPIRLQQCSGPTKMSSRGPSPLYHRQRYGFVTSRNDPNPAANLV